MSRAFLRFCCVGGAATAIQYVVMIALVQLAGTNPTLASGIGFCISAVFNYLMSKHFVFQSARTHSLAASRYLALIMSGLLLNTVCMEILQRVGFDYLLSQVLTTLALLIYNFLLAYTWVFGRRGKDLEEPENSRGISR